MAFQQVTVENRVSEFPNRRTLTKEDNTTEIVTVTRNEGNVSTEGTAWGAAYANDLESRINTETNLLETNFGHVETNTTASKSYSVGETLVLNGQMYKVTAAIAQGATLTVGTNIAVHSVSTINSNINLYVGTDKKLHFVNGSGADSALPFNPGADFDGHYYSGWQSYQCLSQTITFGVPDTTHKNYVVTFTYAASASFSVSGCTTVEKMQYNYTVGSNTVYVCTFIITDVTASTLFSVYGYGTSVGYRVFCGFD